MDCPSATFTPPHMPSLPHQHPPTAFHIVLLLPLICYCSIFCMYCSVTIISCFRGRTRWKLHVKWNSHCIMSKKMGMVAFRSSISGTSVISRIGPTISGMNFILWGPCEEKKNQNVHINAQYATLICRLLFRQTYKMLMLTGHKSLLCCDIEVAVAKKVEKYKESLALHV